MLKHLILAYSILSFDKVSSAELPFAYFDWEYKSQELSYEILRLDPLGILRLRRNTIFASHGRAFKDSLLQSYFNLKPWYYVDSAYHDSLLTSTDKKNIQLILGLENEIGKKFKYNDKELLMVKELETKGLYLKPGIRLIDLMTIDLNQDDTGEIILLSIPWAFYNLNGNIDPGNYTSAEIFVSEMDSWRKIPILIDGYSNDPFEYFFVGEPIDGVLRSFNGTDYMAIADKNQNGFPEIYLRETALASTPGFTTIIEFREHRFVPLFRESYAIVNFTDFDNNGTIEFVTNTDNQLYGVLTELYEYYFRVYEYQSTEYVYNAQLTIEYLERQYQGAYQNLQSEPNLEEYLHTLRLLLQLSKLQIPTAVERAKQIVTRYHKPYIGREIRFGKIPGTEETINDFISKASN